MTDAELFDELNAQHFGGRLPRFEVHRAAIEALGQCEPKAGVIRLRESLSDDYRRPVLLHEAAHAALYQREPLAVLLGPHSAVFVAELRRLVEAGEFCLRPQLTRYERELVGRFEEADRLARESERVCEANRRRAHQHARRRI